MIFRQVAAALTLLAATAPTAPAQGVPENFWGAPAVRATPGARMSVEEMQLGLLWTGFYFGGIDGEMSDDLRAAIRRFQASLGDQEDGALSEAQARTLRERALRAEAQADFQTVHDPWTGISAPLPMGYLSGPQLTQNDDEATSVSFSALGSAEFSVVFQRIEKFDVSAKQVFDYLLGEAKKDEKNEGVVGKIEGEFFRIILLREGHLVVRMYQVRNREARGVLIRYPQSRANIFAPIQMRIFAGIEHFKSSGFDKRSRDSLIGRGESPGYAEYPAWMRTMVGNGSGSIVTFQGHILTNHHVVDGCERLTVNGNSAVLIGVDIVNDLAIVRSDAFARRSPVRFRMNDARLGEEVVVVGYPIWTTSRSLNLTTGVVAARAGLGGDRRNIQITAPVQPGNSGGPVLDSKGQQIAVVVAKFAVRAALEKNVENVAYVIRSDVAKEFMAGLGVTPIFSDAEPGAEDLISDVAEEARRFTVRVECHR